MKKLIVLFSLFIVCLLSSCAPKTSTHEVQWSGDGKDSVVQVEHYDQQGNMSSFFMNYLLFRMLMSQGGYNHVYTYYQGHHSEFSHPERYHNYSSRNDPRVTSYSSKSGYTSPSRSSGSYNSPSRSSSSSPSKSYSSPSRSTYSSPSRSSYSSPSRSSYSSPSRSSYSSPSRR